MSTTVKINPEMLFWALKRSGKTVDDLVKALPRLPEWLKQEAEPTVKQLEVFSKRVHLPFGYLFLPEPPKETLPFPYFRHGSKIVNSDISLNIADTVRSLQQRQQWLSEYLQEDGHQPLSFIGRFSTKNGIEDIVEDIRNTLGLALDWASDVKDAPSAFRFLVNQIEEIGIIVVVNGIVGNNTKRKIDAAECRGFILVNEYCPFLFINNSDAESAKLFTLIHELAHVWLGKSAGFDTNQFMPANDPVEQLCDKVAAEFLVPGTIFKNVWQQRSDLGYVARYFKVSRIVIARRALDLGFITKGQFFSWYSQWQFQAQQKKEESNGGGDYYNNQINRVSLRFAAFIDQAVQQGKLSHREAYKLTGLSGDTYHHFINAKLK
ncbi:ImmA/IrrE family metallo-endopeptidase [Taibaiella soli]|uniref:IrrE N-terminal-like domain-containing protein n=1 Tax=Taibaiella soli TaxID=1649169 RepID=A0A2W2AGI0_9BACT|nr:ImmA/IrrE family metallo-endopeptidase [Taibaiella soli]PZF72632.1 hypothetical protein DN068_12260 [Taibaiella soli]